MFGLHPDTIETLKMFFHWNHIPYSDQYTRWGRKESYTCLAFCTDLDFRALVKMLFSNAIDYAEAERLRVETIQVELAKLMKIMELTDDDPDGVFPAKTSYHTVYYFPEIHLED